MHEHKKKARSTTGWAVIGVLGAATVVGGVALAMRTRAPASLRWFGYQILVESRGLDEAAAGGNPLRWSVSRDDRLLASGPAKTYPHAVDAAKSAIEQLAESRTMPAGSAELAPEVG